MQVIVRYVLVTLSCLLLLASTALAAGFSADIVSVAGGETMTGKIYASQDKMRFETAEVITITRMDKGVTWMLMQDQKMYMEQAIPKGTVIPAKEPSRDEVERVLVGTESFDGKPTDKYKVTVKSGDQLESHFQWIAKDSGFPVKLAAIDGSWRQEYRNLSFSEPAAELFEIPAGYQKMQMPF